MEMNDADSRLNGAIMEAYSEGTPLGLALATGLLLLLHFLIMLLGFVLIFAVTLLISKESFLDDVSFISYQGLFAWVIGAYANYLYRTNSTIEDDKYDPVTDLAYELSRQRGRGKMVKQLSFFFGC